MEHVDAELHGWVAGAVPQQGRRRRQLQALLESAMRPEWNGPCASVSPATTCSTSPGRWCSRPPAADPAPASSWRCWKAWPPPRAARCTEPPAPDAALRPCRAHDRSTPASPTCPAASTRTPRPRTSCGRCSTIRPGSPQFAEQADRFRAASPSVTVSTTPAGCRPGSRRDVGNEPDSDAPVPPCVGVHATAHLPQRERSRPSPRPPPASTR